MTDPEENFTPDAGLIRRAALSLLRIAALIEDPDFGSDQGNVGKLLADEVKLLQELAAQCRGGSLQ